MQNHAEAIRIVTKLLTDTKLGVLQDMAGIRAVGHRVVHGGHFVDATLVTDDVIRQLEGMVSLAPLHTPPNLTGVRACAEVMPGVPQVLVFDTAFHQTMPEKAYLYAIPYEYYEKHKIRRYGFHGTSHRYVSARAAEFLGRPLTSLKLITCHLGNGSSITAVDGGRSVDTSMGFTPLDGVPMGTRSGSIDPAIVEALCDREGLSPARCINILNKKSGMVGLSGLSSDFRDLYDAADQGDARARRALDVFVYAVKKYIGAYAAAMGGVDALVFTAGIGENNRALRAEVAVGLEYMGLHFDPARNEVGAREAYISTEDSPGKILVIPTNEELLIALDTERVVAAMD